MSEQIDITPDGCEVPIYLIPLTEQEEALRAKWNEELIAQSVKDSARAAAKESALAKLAHLGLTEEEAMAIAGV